MGQSARRVIMDRDLKTLAAVDGTDFAIVSIDQWQRRLNQGKIFHIWGRLSINAGNSFECLFTTGNCCTYARFYCNPQRITFATLYEGATAAGSIATTPTSKNRCDPDTVKTRFNNETSVVSTGTLIAQDFVNQSAGGGHGRSQCFGAGSWVLSPNTTYLFRGFNNSGASGTIAMMVDLYEEPA